MRPYSFPKLQENEISKMQNYTVIVESTHSIKSAIKKKSFQIHKYHLFFTMINEYFKKDDEFLGDFHGLFFQKYFLKSIKDFNMKNIPKNKINEKVFPFPDNFILIIASDNSFKTFKEITDRIDKSFPPQILYESGKKYSKLYEKGKKNYKKDVENSQIITEQDTNYNYLNYLIKEINNDINWTCKIIYFDLYFNLIIPKCEITEGLVSINSDISHLNESIDALTRDNNQLNESIGNLQKKNNFLEESMHILKKENKTLEKKFNKIFEFLKAKFSENDISELNKFMMTKKIQFKKNRT